MIEIKTAAEIALIRRSCQITAEVVYQLCQAARPGVTTKELDQLAERLILDSGGRPSFKGYAFAGLPPFPASITTSLNDEIVHGIPSERVLRSGDLLKIDVGVYKDGFHGDKAITVPIGKVSGRARRLMEVTRMALRRGIWAARVGATLGDIGWAIQSYVEAQGFSVVRDFVGHGLGRSLHEDPQVPHFGERGKGLRLQEGMVICLEPMINEGTYKLRIKSDQWTAVTADGKLSAQFEHAIAISRDGPQILTLHESEREFFLQPG